MCESETLPGFRNVQWFSKAEWEKVYTLLFGPNSNDDSKHEALQLLLVWKARNPYLSTGIESTLALLEVDLQNRNDSAVSDRMLRSLYSSALMRFINHASDSGQMKNFTISEAAAQLQIPQWIVTLRNEAAHGHELPSLEILKTAVHFAINWLFKYYWHPQSRDILNYHTAKKTHNFKDKFSQFFSSYNSLLLCKYHSQNVYTVGDISNERTRKGIVGNFQKITNGKVKSVTTLRSMVDILNAHINDYLNETDGLDGRDETMCAYLTHPEGLFMAGGDAVNGSDSCDYVELNEKRVHLWSPLLSMLHKKNILGTLLRKLADIVNDELEYTKIRRAAAQWLKEISAGLYKCKLIRTHISEWPNEENADKMRKQLYYLLVEKYPHAKSGLILDLLQPIPQEISNVAFVHEILSKPHAYHTVYIEQLLYMIEPQISYAVREQLMNIVRIISITSGNDRSSHSTVRTIVDIENGARNRSDLIFRHDDEAGDDVIEIEDASSVWKKVTKEYDWGSYPIGILPWQDNDPFVYA